jgi:hypothetical protein
VGGTRRTGRLRREALEAVVDGYGDGLLDLFLPHVTRRESVALSLTTSG